MSRRRGWIWAAPAGVLLALFGFVGAVVAVPAATTRTVQAAAAVLGLDVTMARAAFVDGWVLAIDSPQLNWGDDAEGKRITGRADRVTVSPGFWHGALFDRSNPIALASHVTVDGGTVDGAGLRAGHREIAASAIRLTAADVATAAATVPANATGGQAGQPAPPAGTSEDRNLAFSAELTVAGVPLTVDAQVATATGPEGRRRVRAELADAQGAVRFDGHMEPADDLRLEGRLSGRLAAVPTGGRPLTLAGEVAVDGDRVTLTGLRLEGGPALAAQGRLDLVLADRTTVKGDLRVTRIDPGPLAALADPRSPDTTAAGGNAGRLPSDWLGAADVDLAIDMPSVRVPGTTVTVPAGAFRVQMDREALSADWRSDWAEEALRARVQARPRAQADGLAVSAELSARDLPVDAVDPVLDGPVSGVLRLETSGPTMSDLRQALDVSLELTSSRLALPSAGTVVRDLVVEMTGLDAPLTVGLRLDLPDRPAIRLTGGLEALGGVLRGTGQTVDAEIEAQLDGATGRLALTAGLDGQVGGRATVQADRLDTLAGGRLSPTTAALPLDLALGFDGRLNVGIAFDRIDASIGETRLQGSGRVALPDWRRGLRADLTAGTLDLAPLLAAGRRPTASEPRRSGGDLHALAAGLKRFTGGLTLTAERVRLPGTPRLTGLEARAALQDGAIDLDLHRLRVGGAAVRGAAYLWPEGPDGTVRLVAGAYARDVTALLPPGRVDGRLAARGYAEAAGKSISDLHQALAASFAVQGPAVGIVPPTDMPVPAEASSLLPGIILPDGRGQPAPLRVEGNWADRQGRLHVAFGRDDRRTLDARVDVRPAQSDRAVLIDGYVGLAGLTRLQLSGRRSDAAVEATLHSTPVQLTNLRRFGVAAPGAGLGSLFVRLKKTADSPDLVVDGSLSVDGVRLDLPAPYDRLPEAVLDAGATIRADGAVDFAGSLRVARARWVEFSGRFADGLSAEVATTKPVQLAALVGGEGEAPPRSRLPLDVGGTAQFKATLAPDKNGVEALAWRLVAEGAFVSYPGLRRPVALEGASGRATFGPDGVRYGGRMHAGPVALRFAYASAVPPGVGGSPPAEPRIAVTLDKPVSLSDFGRLLPVSKMPRDRRRLAMAQLRHGRLGGLQVSATCATAGPVACWGRFLGSPGLEGTAQIDDLRFRPVVGTPAIGVDRLTVELTHDRLTLRPTVSAGQSQAAASEAPASKRPSRITGGEIVVREPFAVDRAASADVEADFALADVLAWIERRAPHTIAPLGVTGGAGRLAVTAESGALLTDPLGTGKVISRIERAEVFTTAHGALAVRGVHGELAASGEGGFDGTVGISNLSGTGWSASGRATFGAPAGALSALAVRKLSATAEVFPEMADQLGLAQIEWSGGPIAAEVKAAIQDDGSGSLSGDLTVASQDACLDWQTPSGPVRIKRCGAEPLDFAGAFAVELAAGRWRLTGGKLALGSQPVVSRLRLAGDLMPFDLRGSVDLAPIPLAWLIERAPSGMVPAIAGRLSGRIEFAWPLSWDGEFDLGGVRVPGVLPSMAPASGKVQVQPRRVRVDLGTPALSPRVERARLRLTTTLGGETGARTNGELTIRRIDARRLLGSTAPSDAAAAGPAVSAASDAEGEVEAEPLGAVARLGRLDEVLRALPVPRVPGRGQVRLSAPRVRVASPGGDERADLQGGLSWRPDRTRLAAEVKSADGILASLRTVVRSGGAWIEPVVEVDASTRAISLSRIWRSALDGEPSLDGRVRVDLSLTGHWRQGFAGMRGELRTEGRDFVVGDARLLAAMLARARDEPMSEIIDSLYVQRLVSRAILDRGTLTVDPLFAQTRLGLAFARVDVDLASGRLDGRGTVKPLDSLSDWLDAIPVIGGTSKSLGNLMQMQLLVSGSLDAVEVTVDGQGG